MTKETRAKEESFIFTKSNTIGNTLELPEEVVVPATVLALGRASGCENTSAS